MHSIRMAVRVVTVLVGVGAAAVADVRVDLVGQWGGGTYAIKVRDDLAYVGIGPRLVILDVQDPTRPVRVGQTEPLGHFVSDIAVQGSFAYVSTYFGGFKIVDIADPAHPRLVSSRSPEPYNDSAVAVAVRDNYAFVLLKDSGLHVFDVSDPAAPEQVATYEFTGSLYQANDIAIAGDTAYVITWSRFVVLDIGDPHDPLFVSDLPIGFTRALEVDGDYAYVVGQSLMVIDVSDPQAPAIVAQYPDAEAYGVALGPDRLYLQDTDTRHEVTVIDRTDPTQLVWRGWSPMESANGGGLAVAGTRVYACDFYTAVRVIDAENADQPAELGIYREFASSAWITSADGRAYSGGSTSGTQVLDVSNPASVTRIAEWVDRLGRRMLSKQVEVRGDIAYVDSVERGPGTDYEFMTLDISDLTSPQHLASLELPDTLMAFVLEEPYAYIANRHGGLAIVDISDPADPRLINTVDTGTAWGLILRDQLAYVTTLDRGLRIYSLANPVAPELLGEFTGIVARCVTLIDDVAFVGGNGGLYVIDVASPQSPQLLHQFFENWGQIESIVAQGRNVLVPLGPGLRVFDATDPREPRLIGTYASQGSQRGVAVSDGLVFLASGDGGVEVLAIRPPGDIDGDGHVDFRDLVQLLTAFGSAAGSEEYNLYADLDSDGRVGLGDLTQLLSRYGQ